MSRSVLPVLSLSISLSLLGMLTACGDDGGTAPAADADPNAPDADPNAPDADPNAPDAMPGNFTDLIEGTWSKVPGGDGYHCVWLNVTEDMYITGFEAVAPVGTHHTVLSVSNDYTGPNKEEACSAGEIADQMLFASGVGTASYALPPGVAIKVSAGQTLMLNLHLFNIGDTTLQGVSGTKVTTTTLSAVENLAEFYFAGTALFSIPGNGTDTMASGSCTIGADVTVFTLWPHMHQVGKHMTITHKGVELLNTPYSFDEQKMYSISPVSVKAGETINVTCTWNNPSGPSKTFGDGSNDEMCFGGVYSYPAYGQNTFCGLGL